MKKFKKTLLIVIAVGLIMIPSMTVFAMEYSSGIVKMSELQEGDIISPGADIVANSSGTIIDCIVFQAKGYCVYDINGNYLNLGSIDMELYFWEDYLWRYDSSDAWFVFTFERSFGPAANNGPVTSWVVVSKEGGESHGYTVTLKGYDGTDNKPKELVPVNYEKCMTKAAPTLSAQKNGEINISWDKLRNKVKNSKVWKNAKYIEIEYSTDKDFSKNVKTKKIKKGTVDKARAKSTLSKLKTGKTYYVRVRLIDKEGVESNWSRAVKVRTK